MDKNSKIYIAGHNGMVGSAILNLLKSEGFRNIIIKSSTLENLSEELEKYI
jgi:GDP-L-fucose synthase